MTPFENQKYRQIVSHYEACLQRHGDTHLGVDWPKIEDVDRRHRVMQEVIRTPPSVPVKLLDFGCGAAHFYDFICRNRLDHITYCGMDLSPKFIELCRSKYPELNFICGDALDPAQAIPDSDYIVMNGVFTEKREMSFDEMLEYFESLLSRLFSVCKIGLAFNVMSKQVQWERDDLFHLPLDQLAFFLTRELSRNFIIRNDYGLYEYTTYLYK